MWFTGGSRAPHWADRAASNPSGSVTQRADGNAVILSRTAVGGAKQTGAGMTMTAQATGRMLGRGILHLGGVRVHLVGNDLLRIRGQAADASGASGAASSRNSQRHAGRCSCRSAHGCPQELYLPGELTIGAAHGHRFWSGSYSSRNW